MINLNGLRNLFMKRGFNLKSRKDIKRYIMAETKDLKKGDKVKHRFRDKQYQSCTILEVEEGCNGLIKVVCEDGFYGGREESTFCPQDLTKID